MLGGFEKMNTEQKIERIRLDDIYVKDVLVDLQKQIYVLEERIENLENDKK